MPSFLLTCAQGLCPLLVISSAIWALYGPSGVGKSTVMKRIAERCREEEHDPARVPVVVVQAFPEDIGSAARLDFW